MEDEQTGYVDSREQVEVYALLALERCGSNSVSWDQKDSETQCGYYQKGHGHSLDLGVINPGNAEENVGDAAGQPALQAHQRALTVSCDRNSSLLLDLYSLGIDL